MYLRLLNHLNQIRSSFWFIPALMCISAFFLAEAADGLDELYALRKHDYWPHWLIYQGDLNGARTLLSTVAGSVITVAGVTFSVTVVALSMASSQFGPRLLLNFMRDTGNQLVLGTFVATFLYCLLALGNGEGTQGFTPAISASLGLALAVLGVWVLIYFMHHVSSSMRAEYVVDVVARDVCDAIERFSSDSKSNDQLPGSFAPDWNQDQAGTVLAGEHGYLQAVNEEGLIELAQGLDTVLKLAHRPGQFVTHGEPLIRVRDREHEKKVAEQADELLIIGRLRTDEQDPEYGIHQLVEIAIRALSPGINDPYTAISCIDWLTAALCTAAASTIPSPHCYDDRQQLRLIRDPITFDGLVRSAYEQIRQHAYGVPSVAIRLMEALTRLAAAVEDGDHHESLRVQADTLWNGCLESGMQSADKTDLRNRYESFEAALQQPAP